MTTQTRMILRHALMERGREWYGLEMVQATGLPSGTVYPIINRLETAEWITSRWEEPAELAHEARPRRRYYQLTDVGEKEARRELAGTPAEPRRNEDDHPVRDRFASQLREMFEASRVSSCRQLVEVCERLRVTQPTPLYELPPLSVSTINDTLTGRRRGLPDPSWLTTFVLCCQVIAFETGAVAEEPGRAGLLEWQERLRRAENEALAQGLFVRRGLRVRAEPVPPPAPFSPETTSAQTSVVELAKRQVDLLRSYGPYGESLLERRDPPALHQMALLLATRSEHANRAMDLLTRAGVAGHREALELLQQSSPLCFDLHLAKTQAQRIADHAMRASASDVVTAFIECVRAFEALTDPSASNGISQHDRPSILDQTPPA